MRDWIAVVQGEMSAWKIHQLPATEKLGRISQFLWYPEQEDFDVLCGLSVMIYEHHLAFSKYMQNWLVSRLIWIGSYGLVVEQLVTTMSKMCCCTRVDQPVSCCTLPETFMAAGWLGNITDKNKNSEAEIPELEWEEFWDLDLFYWLWTFVCLNSLLFCSYAWRLEAPFALQDQR